MNYPVVFAAGLGIVAGAGVSLAFSRVPVERPAAPHFAKPSSSAKDREAAEAAAFHEGLLRAYHAEPIDEAWSASQRAALVAALSPAVAKDAATLEDVGCRSASCVVKIRFPSYEAAHSKMPLYLRPYVRGCMTETLLPPPPNPDAPYDAEVTYDCGKSRAAK